MNSTTNAQSGLTGANAPQKKYVNVREVENGFIVELGYGLTKIAKDKEEVLQFISEVLDRK